MAYPKFIRHPKRLSDRWFKGKLYVQFSSKVSKICVRGGGAGGVWREGGKGHQSSHDRGGDRGGCTGAGLRVEDKLN